MSITFKGDEAWVDQIAYPVGTFHEVGNLHMFESRYSAFLADDLRAIADELDRRAGKTKFPITWTVPLGISESMVDDQPA